MNRPAADCGREHLNDNSKSVLHASENKELLRYRGKRKLGNGPIVNRTRALRVQTKTSRPIRQHRPHTGVLRWIAASTQR
ncbi:hypothetical protein KIN20_002744 [Parelaphostrongylus tenuis]|uniref:Uncharacterized protein n=1 Tax=Parelaphostrongylus tenuis TaxID=148309 RepID=A0AAD5QI26_PARTN|nr:hypothetical protein KIN20_002744 [Parelaphostrongylus tenuis]